MKCSVIIPFYHSIDILELLLKSLTTLPRDSFEVIVIDDCSSSNLYHFEKIYGCFVFRNATNRGPSFSRNVGAQKARGEVLCFIDSDIDIDVEKILKNLRVIHDYRGQIAITGGVSLFSPFTSFFSRYKNYYLNYTFSLQLEKVSFLYGSFVMIKKSVFRKWPEELRYGEDTNLGNSLSQDGVFIYFDHDLQATHYKHFNFYSILKNDFLVPFYFCRTYVENIYKNGCPKELAFSHANNSQLVSIAFIGACCFIFFCSFYFIEINFSLIYFLIFLFWLFSNLKFFKYLNTHENLFFLSLSILFTVVDQFFMGLGIFFGLFFHGIYLNPFIYLKFKSAS